MAPPCVLVYYCCTLPLWVILMAAVYVPKVRLASAGVAFISADYRLMPPSNGHDIVSDIVSLFEFLRTSLNPRLQDETSLLRIDPTRIAVAGSSAGGLCAYLAAAHAAPKPAAVLSLYGLGGSFMVRHWTSSHIHALHCLLNAPDATLPDTQTDTFLP